MTKHEIRAREGEGQFSNLASLRRASVVGILSAMFGAVIALAAHSLYVRGSDDGKVSNKVDREPLTNQFGMRKERGNGSATATGTEVKLAQDIGKQGDPRTEIEDWLQLNFWEKRKALLAMLSGATREDVTYLEGILKNLDGDLGHSEIEMINRRIGELLGVELVDGFDAKSKPNQQFKDRLVGFASVDPAGALKWMSDLPDYEPVSLLAWDLLRGQFDANPDVANSSFKQLKPLQMLAAAEMLVKGNLKAYGLEGGSAAVDQILAELDSDNPMLAVGNQQIALRLVEQMAKESHEDARLWIEKNSGGDLLTDTMFSVYGNAAYGELGGEQLLDWGKSIQGTSAATKVGFLSLADAVAARDPNALGLWLGQNADFDGASRVAEIMAKRTLEIDPESGEAWSEFANALGREEREAAFAKITEINQRYRN